MLDYLKGIVKEICEENNINYTFLSRDWVVKLEKNKKIAYLVGPRFSINSVTSAAIASDKYATYEVLKNAKLPIIEHKMIFNPKYREGFESDLKSMVEIENYLNEQKNKKVIVKANEGACGNDVYLCETISEIEEVKNKIFEDKESLSICPFYEIDREYRLICLDGEVKLVYGKKSANNNWKHNLSQGASAFEVNDYELKKALEKIALDAVKEMGLCFASVDIIKLLTGELLIMEVNSSVTINKYTEFVENGREIAKKIYKEAFLKMLA